MTLASVPRYDPDAAARVGDHAVVVGGSVAGLLAARVLADAFDRVTVVDRDAFPDDPVARDGVPQARQPHVLLEAGRATLEDLFPGYGEDVVAAGGLMLDWTTDLVHYERGGFLASGASPETLYAASRPLFEHAIRARVAARDDVTLEGDCAFLGYRADGDRIAGVDVRRGDGARASVDADLVVDATGRASKTPRWLADNGYPTPPEDTVDVDVTYATTVVERPTDDRRVLFSPPTPPRTRGGGAFPVEGDRWLVTMQGVHGDDPPTDRDGFVEFADSLPVPQVARVLREQAWVTDDIASYPFPSNRRRRYETLDDFPEGLLVVGDAVASFNPVYGQGMSVAALEAVCLHRALADGGRENLAARFFDRATAAVDPAWLLATSSDLARPQTDGSLALHERAFDRYVARLVERAHDDGVLATAYGRVLTMERSPTSLLRPRLAARTLLPSR
ncbi:NAD(P)/FAD-dependent oxidoreductase [Halobacterium litoreum]|uniref:NAD(P)/FAD-dependent oxidoreductase n=1 Tax=Halobacterium litoreum TaxID=2039234 RepID=A0ABD5NDH9_9EURY|nr:FAD-dependent monooxygenase [Halobacterium litoreum]UHH13823.1 FAD-dependent monooxygenase [Halobacterium litoreum]